MGLGLRAYIGALPPDPRTPGLTELPPHSFYRLCSPRVGVGNCSPAPSTGGVSTVLCIWRHRSQWRPCAGGGRVASVWGKASGWLGWARAEGGKGHHEAQGPCVRTAHIQGASARRCAGQGRGLDMEKPSLISRLASRPQREGSASSCRGSTGLAGSLSPWNCAGSGSQGSHHRSSSHSQPGSWPRQKPPWCNSCTVARRPPSLSLPHTWAEHV